MVEKSAVFLLALLSVAAVTLFNLKPQDEGLHKQFAKFKTNFGKFYGNEAEEIYRKAVFMANLAKIEAHNADTSKSHKLGVNQFADLTQQEFISIYLGAQVNLKFTNSQFVQIGRSYRDDIEQVREVDWVSQGKVSPIKNQGMCGSCWAFSTTGSIQSAYRISSSSKQVLLSEQQLVDCSRAYGNQGCNGGWMDSAFQYVIDHGLTTEDVYPYKAKDQECQSEKGQYTIKMFTDVGKSCNALETAVNNQPVSVAVDASSWSLYSGGVLSECGTGINHGVLVVGYNNDYWKIKNSWGQSWGENGYIRIKKGNTCAVCNYASFPSVQ